MTEVRLKSLNSRTATLRARTLVVACGGIENARLLLASNGVEAAGIGNRNGLVEHYFMEHPHALAAYAVHRADLERFILYSGQVTQGTTLLRAKPGLSEPLQRQSKLLNGCVDLDYGYDRSPGYLALRDLAKAVAHGKLPDAFGRDVLDVIGDLDDTTGGAQRAASNEVVLWLAANSEQVPHPESRVSLGAERDALGMPRVKLDWRISEFEKRSVRATCRVVGEELARLGLARVRMDPWLTSDDARWSGVEGRSHHMGTTRMSVHPRTGVVDRDCRIHGYANL